MEAWTLLVAESLREAAGCPWAAPTSTWLRWAYLLQKAWQCYTMGQRSAMCPIPFPILFRIRLMAARGYRGMLPENMVEAFRPPELEAALLELGWGPPEHRQ